MTTIERIMSRCFVAVFMLGHLHGICQASFVNSHLPVATSIRHHDVLRHPQLRPKQQEHGALNRLRLQKSDEKGDDVSSVMMSDASMGNNRRNFLSTMVTTSATFGIMLTSSVDRADAYSGDGSANVKLPNYIEFLIEKNKVVDESSILYKGADSQRQLERLAEAALRLEAIPALAADKKWSQVQGILTGPLGTVLQTMTQVVTSSSKTTQKAAKTALNTFKSDLLAIGEAANRRTVESCIEATEKASQDLEAFIKLTF